MNLDVYMKSVIEQETKSVVICNKEHEIIYMNPAAIQNYKKRGGNQLIGRSLLNCHNEHSKELIIKITNWFQQSKAHNIVHTYFYEKQQKDVYMVALRDEKGDYIGYYEKHEFRIKDDSPFYELA